MKKIFISLIISALTLFALTGCTASTYMSYKYEVETGDDITVKLNTTDGYKMNSETPIKITKDDTAVCQAIFITLDTYNSYDQEIIPNDENSEIYETKTKDNLTYTFYTYNNEEFNYLAKLNNSNTGVILSSSNSKADAELCFSLLSFELEK